MMRESSEAQMSVIQRLIDEFGCNDEIADDAPVKKKAEKKKDKKKDEKKKIKKEDKKEHKKKQK